MIFIVSTLIFSVLSYFYGQQTIYNKQCINFSNCGICFQGIQEKFVFQSCVYTDQCQEYSTHNSSVCIKMKQTILNEQQCLMQCCKNSNSKIFDFVVFKQCIGGNGVNLPTVQMTILVPIYAAILASYLIIGSSYKLWSWRKKQWQQIKLKIKQQQKLNKWVKKQKIIDQSTFTQINQVSAKDFQHNTCSICLEQLTNCKTSCNHYFHIDCYIKWLNMNQKCPLCNNINYNPVTVQCQMCHQMQNRIIINNQFQYISISKKVSCIECRKVKLDSNKQKQDLLKITEQNGEIKT